jgi:hypothetical protein
MGLPMARRLLSAGSQVIAWNRSAAKLKVQQWVSYVLRDFETAGRPRLEGLSRLFHHRGGDNNSA